MLKRGMKYFILLAWLMVWTQLQSQHINPQDSLALVALYNSTNGPSWSRHDNWLVTGKNVSTWYGVTLDISGGDLVVTELRLSDNNLSGSLSSLRDFENIQVLDLSVNQLTGPLPDDLYSLTALVEIHLNDNQLSGDIVKAIRNLSLLEILELQNNHLESRIPGELDQLNNLVNLNLSSNWFIRMDNLSNFYGNGEITVAVENNRLQFDDIDDNYDGLINFSFNPQDSVNSNKVITLFEGDPFQIRANIRGAAMSYNWHKINGNFDEAGIGFNADFTIPEVTSFENQNPGIYYCVVTDDNGSGLTLITRTVTLRILPCNSQINAADSLALVSFYNSTDGPHWTRHDNWLVPHKKVESWFGVSVNCGRVTFLNIDNNNLTGSIPSQIGDLTMLKILQLNDNQLSGGIPSSIGNLRDLDKLILNNNKLSDPLPHELGQLTLMTILYLNDNKIAGGLPQEIGNVGDNLLELRIWNNQMSGPIDMLTRLDAVTNLYINDNHFNGHLPESFTDLTNLVTFDAGRNQLSGTLPIRFSKIQNLTELGLDGNQFTGPIPPEITTLTSLSFLAMAWNQLTGTFPANLGDLINLEHLDFSGNSFDDQLFPGSLQTCLQMQYLGLRANQMNGPVPAFLGSLTHLINIDFGYNFLTGPIPPVLGSLQELEHLDIAFNQLSGPIPVALGNLVSLKDLWLGSNQLSGTIPKELGNDPNLGWLDLSNNQLSGSIPKEFGNLSKLGILFLSSNQLSGSLPPELGNCTNLGDLVVNSNQLSGKIPSTYSSFKKLFWLDLSVNNFTDSIPSFLSANTGLNYLLLSKNNFTHLPDFTSVMPQLIAVALRDNKFTFESIEPYYQVKSRWTFLFDYSPQDSTGVKVNSTVRAGCPFTPNANVGGSHNTYQWYKAGVGIPGATGAILTLPAIAASDAGAYTVQVSNTQVTGLTISTRPITLTVTPAVNTVLAEDPANQLCNAKHLFATPTGLFSYQWYLDGKKIVGATADNYDAFYSGNYTVAFQPDPASCYLKTPVLATAGLYSDMAPIITATGTPVTKLSTTYTAAGYQWYVNDKIIADATTNELPVYYNGTYYLVAKLPNNCQYKSNTTIVSESKYSNLSRLAGAEPDTVHILDPSRVVTIFPNPVKDIAQFEFGQFNVRGIEFFDSSNRSIYRKELDTPASSLQVELSHWAPGIYIVSIWSDEKHIWKKLVKY